MRFLILNADDFSVRRLLSGQIPEGAVLAETETDIRGACRLATELLQGKLPRALKPEDRERLERRRRQGFDAVLLMDPEHPDSQETTKLYTQKWLHDGTAYKYRVPCGNWRRCQNPEGPATVHYSPPSKNPLRTGPVICRDCRLKAGPSELNRSITAQRNQEVAEKRRKERGLTREALS